MNILPELPLLRRELTELANRKRTYIIRVLGAIVILLFLFIFYQQAMLNRQLMLGNGFTSGITQYLGIGGDVFSEITPVLFYAIQVLMPALGCACITAEKENNTIGTLLLTRLTPSTIILEKLGSRLIPMLTLLLLTFPVLAYVYTLGGVDTDLLLGTLWLLFCECLLFASIAIMCSSWFSTTVSAFIWSYVLIAFLAALTLSLDISTFVPSTIWRNTFRDPQGWGMSRAQLQVLNSMGMGPGVGTTFHWLFLVWKSIPSLLVTALFLLIARLVLIRRAFVSQSSVLLKVFRFVDTFFKNLNERTTGGIELVKDSNPLPENDPVAWRERNKKSLGKARYLFRILVLLEVPTFFICMMAAISSARNYFEGLYVLQGLIWTLATLAIAVKGATLFSSERSKQTIDPLLASPMTSIDMLNQKITGMRRLIIVMAVPILTVNLTHALLQRTNNLLPVVYMLLSTFAAFLLLYMVAWLTAGIGLKIHSQTKSVLAAVTVIVAWIILPIAYCVFTTPEPMLAKVIWLFSPLSVVANTEEFLRQWETYGVNYYNPEPDTTPRIVWTLAAMLVYSAVTFLIVMFVRSRSAGLLNRLENKSPSQMILNHNAGNQVILEGSQP
ncbi:MAG: hypothetical protein WBH28_20950 [Fuerstiella sp.]